MKKIISITLILLLLTGLAACGRIGRLINPQPPVSTGQSETPEVSVTQPPASTGQSETPEIDVTQPPASTGQPETPEVNVAKVESIEMNLEFNENAQVTGFITAFSDDGNVVWEYVTNTCNVGQCDVIQEIGLGYTGFMFLEQGSIYCLDKESGGILWVNEDFGGYGASWDFDRADNLYLTGYFGPWLFGVDPDGKTVADFRAVPAELEENGYFLPESLFVDHDGLIRIRYYSNDMTVRIDPGSGELVD
ncbi:MAG: hypothetical protein ACOX75_04480 [Lachnospiraceae bacterium]|jgi:predicted small lipoprotein YifL